MPTEKPAIATRCTGSAGRIGTPAACAAAASRPTASPA